jgi:hypothetical protein
MILGYVSNSLKPYLEACRNKIKPNAFETLDVIVGPGASPSRLGQIPDYDEQVDHPEGLVLKFARVTGTRGRAHFELVLES